jgi:solute carrier family 12 (sodium/potassium/chloride transporter), member 2
MGKFNTLAKFGWFSGVFVPTFLTIIGVIFYLRLGYIVGAAGILGTIIIILISESVVIATAIAISRISKAKVGPGGAFSLIGKTLGYTIGGAVGIPLFFAQAISVSFYLLGFAESWRFIFPTHSLFIVSLLSLIVVVGIVFFSIKNVIKSQYVIFGLIVISLISIFSKGITLTVPTPLITDFTIMPFWALFALFFPAVTGVMPGIGLSGQLNDPKRDISKGIFWAVGSTFLIYITATLWLGLNIEKEVLISSSSVMIDYSFIPLLVTLGILAATFSGALITFVAASRLFQALAAHHLIPFSHFFMQRKKGEPRHAMLLIIIITVVLISLGSLNKVAFLLTIFFLITYGVINYAMLKSYAKTFISKTVAVYGILSSVALIFLVNLLSGVVSVIFIASIYYWLKKKISHIQ